MIKLENEKADALCQLEYEEWRLIRQTAKDTTGLLDAAEKGGLPAVRAYIERLKKAEKTWLAQVVSSFEINPTPKPKTGSLPPG